MSTRLATAFAELEAYDPGQQLNATLEEIYRTKQVTNGIERFDLHSNISREEGSLISRCLATVKPDTYIEVGFAYGLSALYAGSTLKAVNPGYKHIILDPVQTESWGGVGIHNLKQEGLWDNVEFIAKGSEIALPELMQKGTRVQAGFIDGWHTFDHALIDFFYINRMLDVGGIVIFDDANWPAVTKLIRYVLNYPGYEYFAGGHVNLVRSIGRDLSRGSVPRLMPSVVALRKTAVDDRSWDWFKPF